MNLIFPGFVFVRGTAGGRQRGYTVGYTVNICFHKPQIY